MTKADRLIERLRQNWPLAAGFSLPALIMTCWYVSDPYGNTLFLTYGGIVLLVAIAAPIWVGGLIVEIIVRRRTTPAVRVPLHSLLYPMLFAVFFFDGGVVESTFGNNEVGWGVWAVGWYFGVLFSFLALGLVPGRRSQQEA